MKYLPLSEKYTLWIKAQSSNDSISLSIGVRFYEQSRQLSLCAGEFGLAYKYVLIALILFRKLLYEILPKIETMEDIIRMRKKSWLIVRVIL